MKQQIEQIQVPDGYKLVRTEMESGVLFTYEPVLEEKTTIYTYSNDGIIKTILLGIEDDIAYVFDYRNEVSTRNLKDIFFNEEDAINSIKIKDITNYWCSDCTNDNFELFYVNLF